MARIAIVGTRESGKTTLMTVLAKAYQTKGTNDFFLRAMNAETMAFTERNWRRLTQDLDWPLPTPPGKLPELRWALQRDDGSAHEITLVDFAGEIFRAIFGRHNLTDPVIRNRVALDQIQGPLLAHLDQAEVVLLLVNLRDFVNDRDFDQAMETQWSLRGALDYLQPRLGQRIALVFTQIDQYPQLVNGRSSWTAVLQEHLGHTQIAESYPGISCFGVAAVPETTMDHDANGKPFPRPAPNFQSWHLEDLMSFLSQISRVIMANQEAQARAAEALKAKADEDAGRVLFAKWAMAAGVGGFCFLFISPGFGGFLIVVAIIMAVILASNPLGASVPVSPTAQVATPPTGGQGIPPIPPASPRGQEDRVALPETNPLGLGASVSVSPTAQVSKGTELASQASRLGAALLDGTLLGVCSIAVENRPAIGIPVFGLVIVTNIVLLKNRGQTIGKFGGKIKVVDNDSSENPGFMRVAVFRTATTWAIPIVAQLLIWSRDSDKVELAGILLLVNLALFFIDSLMIFNKQCRCLHDFVAGTKVVKIPDQA